MPLMRQQEIHPALTHFPIALLPLALAADATGYVTRDRGLLRLGRLATALTAGSGLVTAAAGFLAQDKARAEGRTATMLATHRNVNLAVVAAATGLAAWRWRRRRPTRASLGLMAGALGLVSYTAWLGGRMVYEYGVGVERAGGTKPDRRHRLPAVAGNGQVAADPRVSVNASSSWSSTG